MTIQPTETIFIDHPPVSTDYDLSLRIRLGIAAAQAKGIDICYIVEDDDFYPSDYFEHMQMNGYDFIGSSKTIYYNLRNRTWREFENPRRSSLCFTGFRISALKDFQWPPDDTLFVDLKLWSYAQRKKHKLIDRPVGVGIKHAIGKFGGIGHRIEMPNKDFNFSFLRQKVDDEAYYFYTGLVC